jgi:predicted nucleic acid-binding protein
LKSALDTNVIVYLMADEPGLALSAETVLAEARRSGALVVCGAVYAELFAHPRLTAPLLTRFLADTGIEPEFDTSKQIWHEAGIRYARYASRRRKDGAGSPRRLLADFIIGAHALIRADRLITFNASDYKRDFPELKIIPGKPQ